MSEQTWPRSEPTDVRLTAGGADLVVDLRGGGLRRLAVGDWELLDSYPAGTVVSGWPGAVLLPWPNRVRNGRWTWQGRQLQLLVTSPEAPNAIHGLLGWQPWTVLSATADAATVGTVIEPHTGYPF